MSEKLSAEWRVEIERRLAEHACNLLAAKNWDEVRAQLWSLLQKRREPRELK